MTGPWKGEPFREPQTSLPPYLLFAQWSRETGVEGGEAECCRRSASQKRKVGNRATGANADKFVLN